MSMPYSTELRNLIDQAFDLADHQQREVNSLHLFLASLIVSPNSVMALLQSMGFSEGHFLPLLSPRFHEEPSLADGVLDFAERAARSHGSRQVDGLHMLFGILQQKDSLAYRLLVEAHIPIEDLYSNLSADIHTRTLFHSSPHPSSRKTGLPREMFQSGEPDSERRA